MEISKRDYFAAQALTGLLASGCMIGGGFPAEMVAARAFDYADAMLKLSRTLMDPVEIDPNQMVQKPLRHDPPSEEVLL